ncbi:glycosyl hydrolase family 28-related protein [Mycolicibacterium sp. XJ2]
MKYTRRDFCLSVFAAALLAGCHGTTSGGTVNVRDHGATGDGVSDDSAAIRAAVDALESGDTLLFPRGSYRFAERNPDGGAAILLSDKSDLAIDFERGAELVMDNVDPGTRTGTSHCILIRGPASRITLRGVRIRWAAASQRSMGDGIRVIGSPQISGGPIAGWEGPQRPVQEITLTDCAVRASPQTGVIMIGVSDIRIAGLQSSDTRADGLHFNACRKATIADYTAVNTGDDGLALVTYQSAAAAYDAEAETFAFPELTDWSNAEFGISRIVVDGGRANGVRIAGANGVTITEFEARGLRSGAGVMVDSAAAGNDVDWHYVASRKVMLDRIDVDGCEFGVHVLARPPLEPDARFTDFDIALGTATFRNCSNWSLRVESDARTPVTGVSVDRCLVEARSTAGGNGGVGLANANSVELGEVVIDHRTAVPMLTIADTGRVQIRQARLTIANTENTGASPCVGLIGSDGRIDELVIRWERSPASWIPIRVTGRGGECAANAAIGGVTVGTLELQTASITRRVTTC